MLSHLESFELLLRMDVNYMPEEFEQDIYHYTSSGGFSSILLGNTEKVILWASRYDCLNDASEGKVVEEVFHEVCSELKDRGEISEYLYELFYNVKPARTISIVYGKGNQIKPSRPECNRFVCSFSKCKDSLAMWNYYSKGNKYEGFNIGFKPICIKESLKKFLEGKKARVYVYPVIYDKLEQKLLIEKMLLELKENYDYNQETSIRCIISNRLTEWSLVFKQDYFQHEEEVRIIVDVAKSEKEVPVKYRVSGGYVVPYIELELKKKDVSCVSFGPLQCEEEQRKYQLQVMQEMLKANGYSVMAKYSQIPVRY